MATDERPELLTPPELEVMDRTADLVNMVAGVMGHGPTREGDWAEFVFHVHGIQRMILKQAAARAYPGRFRLLGEDPWYLDPDSGPKPEAGAFDIEKVTGSVDFSLQATNSKGWAEPWHKVILFDTHVVIDAMANGVSLRHILPRDRWPAPITVIGVTEWGIPRRGVQLWVAGELVGVRWA